MTTNNALNITSSGIVNYNGTGSFSAITVTQYNTLVGGTSNSISNIATGNSGQVLTSNGNAANPSYQTLPSSSISITGNTGGALTGTSFTFTGGTTGLTFSGSGTTETLTGTLAAANGGTGVANSSTITIGGNVIFSGASTFTGTLTGDTSVTFPTSGTLATTSQLSSFSPNSVLQLFDDFASIYSISSYYSVGQLFWYNAGNYAWITDTTNSSKAHPGVITNPAMTANTLVLFFDIGNQALAKQIYLGGGITSVSWVFYITNLSNGTNTYTLSCGLSDTSSIVGSATNAVGFTYGSALNSGNWQCGTASANTRTNSNTSTAVTSGTWYNANITINAAGNSAVFTLNGVTLATIVTNIPTTGLSPYFYIDWIAGTIAAGSISVDLFYMTQNLTAR